MAIIDGRKIAQNLLDRLADEVQKLEQRPGLAVIIVGNNPASKIYVANKLTMCKQVGIYSKKIVLAEHTSEKELLAEIDKLNKADSIDGILVQLPLPKHLEASKILAHITPIKDVDGLHPYNAGRLMQNNPLLTACTPKGIMYLLNAANVTLSGRYAVVVGASNLVGKPMAMLLLSAGATVCICNSKTKNLSSYLKKADIVIVAVGKAKLIRADMLKKDSVVIDVGINYLADGTLVGDVDFESVKKKVASITSVPGGVGPMTVVSLIENTVFAHKARRLTNTHKDFVH